MSPEDFGEVVHQVTGFGLEELRAYNRREAVMNARHVAAWAARQALALSYPQLGELLSRDHRTAMNSCLVVEDALAERSGKLSLVALARRMRTHLIELDRLAGEARPGMQRS